MRYHRRCVSPHHESPHAPPPIVGPGARSDRVAACLQALGAAPRRLGDLAELLGGDGAQAWLDADRLTVEDLGILRRFLASPGRHVVLFGNDAGCGVARRLVPTGARFVPWPADLEALEAALEEGRRRSMGESAYLLAPAPPPPGHQTPRPPRTAAAPTAVREEVERILGAPCGGRTEAASGGDADAGAAETAPGASSSAPPRASEETAGAAKGAGSEAPGSPAPWFKEQVADLTDLVQRIELVRRRAAEAQAAGEAEELEQRLAELELEVARLDLFTRTLALVAAPPTRGEQRFDLTRMVEETLAGVRNEPGAPRILYRSNGPAPVRADRVLLAMALDALLGLAQLCAGPGGTIRVELARGERGHVAVRVHFPAGPLSDLDPQRIRRPYALRRLFPDLGANALAAAESIARGQAGRLGLTRGGEGELSWSLELPLDPTPGED